MEEHSELVGSRPWLTIVVPAYNEAARLPASLQAINDYLSHQSYESEILVVDDGSEDETANRAESLRSRMATLRVLRNPHRGKAFAVRTGVMTSRGSLIFLCDADLSMPIEEIAKFLPVIQSGYGVAVGSREAPGAQRFDEPLLRHLMGRVYNLIVRIVLATDIQDTQCGFKCLSREAALAIFPRLHVRTADIAVKGPMVTGYDVELLYLARKLDYRIAEVGIRWHYSAGSKVSPGRDALRLIVDLFKVRLNDRRGFYDLPRSPSASRK